MMLQSLLLRQLKTNVRHFCYHHLAHSVLLDMMFASAVSRRSNRCAQVYATNVGWARAFQMISRSEAHETLLLMFA